VAVKVLTGSVVAHGGAWVGVSSGDLDVAEIDASIEHGGDVGVSKQMSAFTDFPRLRRFSLT
jgi:hypothetical protein